MSPKKNLFIVILLVSIISFSVLTLHSGGYFVFFKNDESSIRLRDYWWLFTVVAVILIILFDQLFWRKEDKRKIPSEGRLLKLQREIDQDDLDEIENDYKL